MDLPCNSNGLTPPSEGGVLHSLCYKITTALSTKGLPRHPGSLGGLTKPVGKFGGPPSNNLIVISFRKGLSQPFKCNLVLFFFTYHLSASFIISPSFLSILSDYFWVHLLLSKVLPFREEKQF